MENDEEVQPPEPAQEPERQAGWAVADWVVRTGSTLSLAALSVTVWQVQATLRLAKLATDFAFRAPADLVARAAELLGQRGGAAPNLPGEVNRAFVLRLYRAAVQADLATARRLFDEDVSTFPARSRWPGSIAVSPRRFRRSEQSGERWGPSRRSSSGTWW